MIACDYSVNHMQQLEKLDSPKCVASSFAESSFVPWFYRGSWLLGSSQVIPQDFSLKIVSAIIISVVPIPIGSWIMKNAIIIHCSKDLAVEPLYSIISGLKMYG